MQCAGCWEAVMTASQARSQDIMINYTVMIRRWGCGWMKMFVVQDGLHHC